MKKLLKNWLLVGKILFCVLFIITNEFKAQKIANYISNGSFELAVNTGVFFEPKCWSATDSGKGYGVFFSKSYPPYQVPLSGGNYQWPKHGDSFLGSTIYCLTCGGVRDNPRNRLKENLRSGKKYCVKFFCNIANKSSYGSDGLGAYFGDSNLDTITYCNKALIFLTPQVKNPQTNILADTLNWIPITGTFVANGSEKYLVIGNFLSDNVVDSLFINPSYLPDRFTDIYIDAVSCVEIDVGAYAGPDQSVAPGDSVYIGRENDFAIDSGCVWYKWPNMTTAIDTISGLWVKPVTTTTYIVRQELECSSLKWDTVVVYMNLTGVARLEKMASQVILSPNPAQNDLTIQCTSNNVYNFNSVFIFNNMGQLVREEEVIFKGDETRINTRDLQNGIYFITVRNPNNEKVTKKLVIAK